MYNSFRLLALSEGLQSCDAHFPPPHEAEAKDGQQHMRIQATSPTMDKTEREPASVAKLFPERSYLSKFIAQEFPALSYL